MANLQSADLRGAHLEGALLAFAHLEGADLRGADLKGTDLRNAWLDGKTVLYDTSLNDKTRLADIQWGGVGVVNLTRIDWRAVLRLGDESALKHGAKPAGYEAVASANRRYDDPPGRQRLSDYEAVLRAYRQLAAQFRAQGMSEVADRFQYRAQVRQRKLLFRRGRIFQWLGSVILAALAGYGYRPGRSVFWYLVTIGSFATAYFLLGSTQGHTFQPDGALVFSVTSFHGRGFFPENLNFEGWVTRFAALEAVLGLLIEISFIATFTQRFFNAR